MPFKSYKRVIKIFLTFILAFWAGSLAAQQLEGRIVDERMNPVSYANVVLLSLPDSTFTEGVVSEENGHFQMKGSLNGKVLRISAVGYMTQFLKSVPGNGMITLATDTQMLQEVSVRGTLPHTQVKGDALVTQVQGSVLEKAGTLEQLLQKIPNVTVNNDDEVKVFGRGTPEIYINSRKLRDNTELSQISADQIHSIEVITHPGARYGASVPAVIRIKTQKAAGEGFSFSDRAYLRHNMKKFSVLNQYDFNYRKGGLDVSGMLDLHRNNIREESNDPIWLYVNNTVWKQDQYTMGNNPSEGLNGRISLNYTFNDHHALGIRYDVMCRDHKKWTGYMATTLYKDDAFQDYSYDDDHVELPETRHSVNAYYIGQLGNFHIDWNNDFFFRKRDRNQVINESYRDLNDYTEEVLIESLNHTTNHLVASKLVGTTELGKGELSIGSEFTYTDQVNDFRNPQQIMASVYSELYEREWCFFAEYTLKLGKTRLQAGIRYELINSDYYQDHVRNTDSSRDYKDLFPTFSFTAPIGNAQWSLRYTQGITRPSYSSMRGSVSYLCRYAYETGNPMLRPTFTKELSTSLTYKWIQLELGFTRFKDPVFYTSKLLREDDIITYVYERNEDAFSRVTTALNLSPQIGCWTPRWGVALQKQWVEMDTPFGHHKLNSPYCTITWQNAVTLKNDWLFSCDMQLDTKGYIKNAYQYKNNFNMRASITKSFWDDRLNLQLEGTNVLGTYQDDPSRQYCGPLILLDLGRTKMSTVTLTARYKFNTSKSKYRGTGAGQSQRSRF